MMRDPNVDWMTKGLGKLNYSVCTEHTQVILEQRGVVDHTSARDESCDWL